MITNERKKTRKENEESKGREKKSETYEVKYNIERKKWIQYKTEMRGRRKIEVRMECCISVANGTPPPPKDQNNLANVKRPGL